MPPRTSRDKRPPTAYAGAPRLTLRPVVYAGLVHDVRAIFCYCWKQTSGGKVGKQKQDRNGSPLFGEPCEKLAGPGRIKRRFKPWETVVYGW